MDERPPVPPNGTPASVKDAAAASSAPQGEVQELFSIDVWGAVFIAIMMLLGLMRGKSIAWSIKHRDIHVPHCSP